MTFNSKKIKAKVKRDWSRAQIIAALHDNGITLSAIAKAHRLKDSTSLSSALSHSYPKSEKRIADALNMKPMDLWPTRYNSDGTRVKRFSNTQILLGKGE